MKQTIFILLFLISCVGPQTQRTQNLQEKLTDVVASSEQICITDADCTIIALSCCSCTAGGKNTAVNVAKKDEVMKRRETVCKEIMCAQVISNDESCSATKAVCKNAVCGLE